MEKPTSAGADEPEPEPVLDLAAALAAKRVEQGAPAPDEDEDAPVQPDGHSADNVHDLAGLRGLYDELAVEGQAVEGSAAGFAHEDKLTRIIHFAGEHKISFGRLRWRRLIVIKPGKRAWVAHTVNPDTGRPESWECYGPGIDPAAKLANRGQRVITMDYKRDYGGPWLRFWRWFYGRRMLTDVDYAKWLTGLDIPRIRKRHHFRQWALDRQPAHRQTSKSKAAFLGIRAYIGELLSWL